MTTALQTWPAASWTFGQPGENTDVRTAADKVTESGHR